MGVDFGSMIGSVLGGGGAGNAILGHVFGARQGQAAQGLGQTTGLGAQGAGQLMAMLAPLVMGVLGNMQRSQGLGSSGLAGVLGQEAQRVQQGGIGGLLGSIFDRDGDGKVGLDEIAQVGQGLLGAFNKRV